MFRAAIGFQHVVKTVNPVLSGVQADWWTTSGYNITGTNFNTTAVDAAEGWLAPYSPSVIDQVVAFPMAGKLGQNPNKLTIGFRLKCIAAYAGAHSILHITDPASPTSVAYYLWLAGSTSPWQPSAGGAPVHCEFTLDIQNNKVSALINGVPIADYTPPTMSANVKAALLNGTALISFRLGTSVGGRYGVKDITVLDDLPGDGITGPIGVRALVPIYVDEVTAEDYVKSDPAKTPLQHMTTALPTLATLTSPTNKNPLTVSLKADIPAGARIDAVDLNFSARSSGDGASPVKVEISQGGTTLAPKQASAPLTMAYGIPLGVLQKAPDGTAWTTAKLDSTTVKLTPDTVV